MPSSLITSLRSLPVGGPSTHSVLVGHRGLSTASLFTRLDEMKTGDLFMITVLGYKLYYQVDQITVVNPDEIDELQIERGMDYCTLLTCTPFGINTQRLLVRGARIPAPEKETPEVSGYSIPPLYVAVIAALAAVFILVVILTICDVKKHNRRTDNWEGGRQGS